MQHAFIHDLITLFSMHADGIASYRKKAYMRHQYEFFGIWQPHRAQLQKTIFNNYPITSMQELDTIVKKLWLEEKRECHYAAIDLLQGYKKLWNQNTLTLLEYCIINNSWWDTIDDIASNCVGTLCAQYPELIPVMDIWIESENMWLRRTALIFQLKYKTKTDTKRLFAYCTKRMHEKEFFIRKAIGWALREYSKTNPTAVAHFVAHNSTTLSPLSKREACKYLPPATQT
jgi:3-methyladenine DNA glycosylase AlkD